MSYNGDLPTYVRWDINVSARKLRRGHNCTAFMWRAISKKRVTGCVME